jgi:hypothetical protein
VAYVCCHSVVLVLRGFVFLSFFFFVVTRSLSFVAVLLLARVLISVYLCPSVCVFLSAAL